MLFRSGRANAILLPHVIEFNTGIDITSCSRPSYPYHVERYENIARILGLQNLNTVTTIRSLVNWVQFMLQELEKEGFSRLKDILTDVKKDQEFINMTTGGGKNYAGPLNRRIEFVEKRIRDFCNEL